MPVDRYVGLNPPALLRLERELVTAADELAAMRAEAEATLASVGRSWPSATKVRATEEWLRSEALDVRRRRDEIDSGNDSFWSELKDPYLAPLAGIGLGVRRTIWPKDVRDCGELRAQIENTYVHDIRERLRQILEDVHGWRLSGDHHYETHIDSSWASRSTFSGCSGCGN